MTMLSATLKKNRTAGYLVLTILVLGAWFFHLADSPGEMMPRSSGGYLLSALVLNAAAGHLWLIHLLSILLLVINSLLLHRIYLEYLSPGIHSLYPALIFALVITGTGGFPSLYPGVFAVIFLLFGLNRLFSAFDRRKPFSNLFDAGFFLGAGSLFWHNLLILLPAFMAGAYLLSRDARWREMTLVLLGTIVPLVITAALLVLTDHPELLEQVFPSRAPQREIIYQASLPEFLFLAYLGLLTLAGSYRILTQVGERKVNFRMYFTIFFLMFLLSVLLFFMARKVTQDVLLLASVPVAFLLTNLFLTIRNDMVREVCLLAGLLLALAAHVF